MESLTIPIDIDRKDKTQLLLYQTLRKLDEATERLKSLEEQMLLMIDKDQHKEWYSPEEVAKEIGYSPEYVRGKFHHGEIKGKQITKRGSIKIHTSEVRKLKNKIRQA